MKKFIIFTLLICTFMCSCSTMEDKIRLSSECSTLVSTKSDLQKQIDGLYEDINNLRREKVALQSGREPRYIVRLKIKQGTFTLDIFEHVKNELNSIEIEVPVIREYYNSLQINQDLTDSFKWGSLIMDGDFSTLHMRVVGKRIE